jgi:hypothetical protein
VILGISAFTVLTVLSPLPLDEPPPPHPVKKILRKRAVKRERERTL